MISMMFFNLTKGKKEKKEKKESLRHSYELVNYRPPAGVLSMIVLFFVVVLNILNPPKQGETSTIKTSTSLGFQVYIIRIHLFFWGVCFLKN